MATLPAVDAADPDADCQIACTFPYGWCTSPPYSYRCTDEGGMICKKLAAACTSQCYCQCDARKAASVDAVVEGDQPEVEQ